MAKRRALVCLGPLRCVLPPQALPAPGFRGHGVLYPDPSPPSSMHHWLGYSEFARSRPELRRAQGRVGAPSKTGGVLANISRLERLVSPVTFPPGRAKFDTRPRSTGSKVMRKTRGIWVLARFAASDSGGPQVTSTSKSKPTTSVTSGRTVFCRPPVYLYSILMF